jgi:hypothetical protein
MRDLDRENHINLLAQIAHEVNRAYCQSIGDNSQLPWFESPVWQRESAVVGVRFCMNNPNAPASANHDSWLKQKVADGWIWGPVKDPAKKEHPCMVPYEALPKEQQTKDALFKAVCTGAYLR